VPRFPLREGRYYIDLGCDVDGRFKADRVWSADILDVAAGNFFGTGKTTSSGEFLCDHSWSLKE
jgi:hypothetical protein